MKRMTAHLSGERKNILVLLARARKFIESRSDGTIRSRKWSETSSTFNFSPRDDLSITTVDRGATSGFHIVPNDSYPSGKFRSQSSQSFPSLLLPPPFLSFSPHMKTKYEV